MAESKDTELLHQIVNKLTGIEGRLDQLEADRDADPDDPLVREAQARLAKDAETDTFLDEPEGETAEAIRQVKAAEGGVEVTLAPPTVHQKFVWDEMVRDGCLVGLTRLSRDAARDAFVKGGPLWLYAFDRAYVLGLPYYIKQAMVTSVAETMPHEARAMGADLFKYRDTESQIGWAMTDAGVSDDA